MSLSRSSGDHLPLYRQSEIYARDGVDIERSTMAEWVGKMTFLPEPLAEERLAVTSAQARRSMPPTTRQCLCSIPDVERRRPGDQGLPSGTSVRGDQIVPPPLCSTVTHPTVRAYRQRLLAERLRSGFLHVVRCMLFPRRFNPLYEIRPEDGRRLNSPRLPAGLSARRKIYEVHDATALRLRRRNCWNASAKLFAVEEAIRGKLPGEHFKAAARNRPFLNSQACESSNGNRFLARSAARALLRGALRYSLSRWPAFTRYTTDGCLDICNNVVERAIRPLARAQKLAVRWFRQRRRTCRRHLHPIIETAKLNGLDLGSLAPATSFSASPTIR